MPGPGPRLQPQGPPLPPGPGPPLLPPVPRQPVLAPPEGPPGGAALPGPAGGHRPPRPLPGGLLPQPPHGPPLHWPVRPRLPGAGSRPAGTEGTAPAGCLPGVTQGGRQCFPRATQGE